jgi:hypothetical protein
MAARYAASVHSPLRLAVLALTLSACSTMSGARPLARGEHAVGVTVGGALLDFGGPLPLPNIVVEGAHGVAEVADRPLDLRYGLNATALPFGLISGHVGSSWLLVRPKGAIPRLALTDRVFFATNLLGLPYKTDPVLQGWVADQIELTASYDLGHQLVYASVSEYIDLQSPALTFTPALGAQLDPGQPGGFFFQPELRWFALGQVRDSRAVQFASPSGALGVSLGFGTRFGKARTGGEP